jgi:hypothetical protein
MSKAARCRSTGCAHCSTCPEICDAYPLDATKARALTPLVIEAIDIERYNFFLQRCA